MHIHSAILYKYMISPYLIEQLRTAVYPLGVSHQKMQQPEFGRTQHYFIAVGGYAMSSRVEVQSADLDHIVGCFGRAPPQHRLDSREHLTRRERLGNVIVGPDLQPRPPYRLLLREP